MAENTIEIVPAPIELTEAELEEITGGAAVIVPPCSGAACSVACETR